MQKLYKNDLLFICKTLQQYLQNNKQMYDQTDSEFFKSILQLNQERSESLMNKVEKCLKNNDKRIEIV